MFDIQRSHARPFRPCSPAPIKANTVLLAVVIRVWTSSFRLLPVEILSISRWVALFVADISLLFRYHLCYAKTGKLLKKTAKASLKPSRKNS
jgi:hypothetical protein